MLSSISIKNVITPPNKDIFDIKDEGELMNSIIFDVMVLLKKISTIAIINKISIIDSTSDGSIALGFESMSLKLSENNLGMSIETLIFNH